MKGRDGEVGGVTGLSRCQKRERVVEGVVEGVVERGVEGVVERGVERGVGIAYLMIESVCLKVARPFHAAAATPPNQMSKVSAFGQQPRRSISCTTCQALCQPWREGIRAGYRW